MKSWLHRNAKKVIILVLAVLTTILLMVLVRMNDKKATSLSYLTVKEQEGVYDLTEITNWDKTVAILPPGNNIYPEMYLTPENADTGISQSSEAYEKNKTDYVTQRFSLKVPKNSQVYTLDFRLKGRHALKAYINGVLAGQMGTPGTTKKTTEIGENHLICFAAAKNGEIEIILQCAQFYHYKYNGANLATISLHKADRSFDPGVSMEDMGFFLTGGLLFAALLLMVLFFFNRGSHVTLYFSLTCLAMVVREGIQSQIWIKFSFLSGKLTFMMEYLSVVLLTVFLTLYLGELLIGKLWRAIKYTVLATSFLYLLCLLFGDSLFYTAVLKFYQGILIICILCAVAGLFWQMTSHNKEQTAALYGIAVFYLSAVSDILMYNNLTPFSGAKASVSEIAMLVFVISETVSLFLMNIRMIEESKKEEQRLAGEKEVLESINHLKTEFLGNVSHELKTPLTVISSYAQFGSENLVQKEEGQEVRDCLKLIGSEADRLAMMVSQILDVTCIEENRMVISRKSCSLIDLIQYTLDAYYPVFTKNGNRLVFQPDREVVTVSCDRDRIIQVLVNLIGNACKHTRNGTITVRTEKREEAVAVIIADTGTGIDKDRLAHLFERYYTKAQGEEESAQKGRIDTGTGLGLYVCRHIIKEHGGEITIESETGKGTTVTFTLNLVH